MPRLNEIQCAQIIALLEEELSQNHIARRVGDLSDSNLSDLF